MHNSLFIYTLCHSCLFLAGFLFSFSGYGQNLYIFHCTCKARCACPVCWITHIQKSILPLSEWVAYWKMLLLYSFFFLNMLVTLWNGMGWGGGGNWLSLCNCILARPESLFIVHIAYWVFLRLTSVVWRYYLCSCSRNLTLEFRNLFGLFLFFLVNLNVLSLPGLF